MELAVIAQRHRTLHTAVRAPMAETGTAYGRNTVPPLSAKHVSLRLFLSSAHRGCRRRTCDQARTGEAARAGDKAGAGAAGWRGKRHPRPAKWWWVGAHGRCPRQPAHGHALCISDRVGTLEPQQQRGRRPSIAAACP